jgi:predicted transcriptional regulator
MIYNDMVQIVANTLTPEYQSFRLICCRLKNRPIKTTTIMAILQRLTNDGLILEHKERNKNDYHAVKHYYKINPKILDK